VALFREEMKRNQSIDNHAATQFFELEQAVFEVDVGTREATKVLDKYALSVYVSKNAEKTKVVRSKILQGIETS